MYKIEYFSHARGALLAGLRSLSLIDGTEILLPSYMCSVVTDVFNVAKLTPVYYDVDDALRPIWSSVKIKLGQKCGAFVLVHYFGLAQNAEEALEFCRNHGLVLIEDNAHGFGALYSGRPLGTIGHIGIASPRKIMNIRNGGILYFSGDIPNYSYLQPEPGRLRWRVKTSIKSLLRFCPNLVQKLKPKPDYLSVDAGREISNVEQLWSPDYGDMSKIISLDTTQERTRRRACWNLWLHWAYLNGLEPLLHHLSDGDSPLCFPVRISDLKLRFFWIEWGWHKRIDVYSWPALPQDVIERRLSGYKHWQEILCFAIPMSIDHNTLRRQIDF